MEHTQALKFIHDLLRLMISRRGSDLLLIADLPPSVKVDGKLTKLSPQALTGEHTQALARALMNDHQAAEFERTKEGNFAVPVPGIGRFRVNAFMQQSQVGMVLRVIANNVPTLDELGLPAALQDVVMAQRGLCVLAGATGSGKSTTLAAMIDWRNENSHGHIITIEDPVKFIHTNKGCAVTQREIGIDTENWDAAFKNALHQTPDVIVMGSIHDRKTLEQALAFAKAGHLCIATLHAYSSTRALDAMLSFVPEEQRPQLLMELSVNLRSIVSQRLVPRRSGAGRIAMVEILLNTPKVADCIFKGDIADLKEQIQSNRSLGMQTLDHALFDAYEANLISYEDALRNADSFNELRIRLKLHSTLGRFENLTGITAPPPSHIHLVKPAEAPFPKSPPMSTTLASPLASPVLSPSSRSYEASPACKVAFLGLGVMGYPMAGHLARAGHEVTVYNRTSAKAEAWCAEFGGRRADTPRLAAMGADFVFSCVGNDDDLRSVMLGADGAFAGLEPGAIVVDHTTASADVARELSSAAKTLGLRFIDAPVSGGQAGAQNGALTVMCGGTPTAFEQAQPLVLHFARACTLMGDSGAGQLTKMVNQICIAGLVQGLAEALAFGGKAGLDVNQVLDVIGKGAAQSWQLDNRGKTMVADQFDFGFAVDWMRKDLGLVLEEARRNGARLPVTALVDQFYADVQDMGGSRWDTSSLIKRLR